MTQCHSFKLVIYTKIKVHWKSWLFSWKT